MTISAEIVEGLVVAEVRRLLTDVQGSASAGDRSEATREALDRAQALLDASLRAFTGFEGEQAAIERLGELRDDRDRAAADHASAVAARGARTITLNGDADWEVLTGTEKRDLLVAVIERVEVSPGRGPSRVTITARP